MSAGFGWSVGDVVLLTKTIRKVSRALKDEDGSSSEFQKTIKSLESFYLILSEINAILKNAEPAFRNAARAQLDVSTSSIADFNKKLLGKYGKSLGCDASKTSPLGMVRKVSWSFLAAQDVQHFQVELSRQVDRVKLLMMSHFWYCTLCCPKCTFD